MARTCPGMVFRCRQRQCMNWTKVRWFLFLRPLLSSVSELQKIKALFAALSSVWQTCPKAFQGVLRGSQWWQGGGAAKASKTHSYNSTDLHTIDIILIQLGSNSWRYKVNIFLTKVNSFKAILGCSLAIVFQWLGPCSFKRIFQFEETF